MDNPSNSIRLYSHKVSVAQLVFIWMLQCISKHLLYARRIVIILEDDLGPQK